MSEEIKLEQTVVSTVEVETKIEQPKETEMFRFFKNCSGTLKKLSVAVFVINLFLIVITAVLGVVMVGMYVGFEVVAMLAVPFISVIAILVIFARLVSALIYGFAEIVEKCEK